MTGSRPSSVERESMPARIAGILGPAPDFPVATLTVNPGIDVSFEVAELLAGEKVHARRTRYDPGGNGINVSRALHRLGRATETCCLVAGESGQFLRRLMSAEVESPHFIEVDGETRVNCTVVEPSPWVQYEVSGIGPEVDDDELAAIADLFLKRTVKGIGVLTGSLPPGVPVDFYARIAGRLREQGARAVVDATPELLRAALAARPFLIKPNRLELEGLVGRRLADVNDLVQAGRSLLETGVDTVCISLAADGALLMTGTAVYQGTIEPVEVCSTVGAGDSLLAGLVAALSAGADPAEALRLGLACGTGTSIQPGTQLFDVRSLDDCLGMVSVRKRGD